jgi:hypothetical protein
VKLRGKVSEIAAQNHWFSILGAPVWQCFRARLAANTELSATPLHSSLRKGVTIRRPQKAKRSTDLAVHVFFLYFCAHIEKKQKNEEHRT